MAGEDAGADRPFSIDPISAGQRLEPKKSEQRDQDRAASVAQGHESTENTSGVSIRIRSGRRFPAIAAGIHRDCR